MQKTISLKQKEAVELTTELSVQGIYVTVNVTFQRKHIINKGTAEEKEFSNDFANETVQIEVSGEQLEKPVTGKIEDLVNQAIQQAKQKYE